MAEIGLVILLVYLLCLGVLLWIYLTAEPDPYNQD